MRFTRYTIWTAAFVCLFAFCLGFKGCGKTPAGTGEADLYRSLDGMGIPTSDAKLKHSYTTPGGARVGSVTQVPAEFLSAIDEGVMLAVERRVPGWNKITSPAQVRVLIIEPSTYRDPQHPRFGAKCVNEYTEPGSPCLLVNGVQTAGTVVGIQQLNAVKLADAALIIPHQALQGWSFRSYFMHSVWYETEHLLECVNEGRDGPTCLYYQKVDDTHPHRP